MDSRFDFLARLERNILLLASQNDKTVVLDGKYIGPGVGNKENLISQNTISPTGEEAIHQKNYEDSLLGNLPDNLTEEEIDEVVQKYLDNIAEKLFEGVE